MGLASRAALGLALYLAILHGSNAARAYGRGLGWAHGARPRPRLSRPQPPRHSPQPSHVAAPAAPLETALRPPALDQTLAILKMSRPRTLPQSLALVAIGAYAAERSFSFLGRPGAAWELLLVSALVALTTATSMIVNDYYDFVSGVDTADSQAGRPLVQGRVSPREVKGALKWLYGAHLGLLLLLRSTPLRVCVYANTMATYLYTRHFKPIPGVKNALCATVVATTLSLGAAVAKGSFAAGAAAVWPCALALGCGILHREMVMDVDDVHGDRAAGVNTLAVILGERGALWASLLPLGAVAAVLCARGGPTAALAALPYGVLALLAARATRFVDTPEAERKRALALDVELAPVCILATLLSVLWSTAHL